MGETLGLFHPTYSSYNLTDLTPFVTGEQIPPSKNWRDEPGWTMNKSDPHLTGNIGSTHLQRLWNCNSFMIQPWTDENLKKVLKSPIFDLCFFSCLQVPRIFRYESWWFGFPFNLCRGVIARRFKRLDHLMQAKRPSDRWTHTAYLFWKSCWFFSWFFLVCVFFGPKQKTLHLCPGWSPGYWVLKSDTSRIQWNRVPLIASKSSSWKPEMWMALEFWSWNKNDSEYFHFHQFWAKRDLPV